MEFVKGLPSNMMMIYSVFRDKIQSRGRQILSYRTGLSGSLGFHQAAVQSKVMGVGKGGFSRLAGRRLKMNKEGRYC